MSHIFISYSRKDIDFAQKIVEQVMDESPDDVTIAGFDSAATERARAMVESFKAFLEEHRDEITALQIIYSIPRRGGQLPTLTYDVIKELAEVLQQPPRTWTTESLWRAYATLERNRVRGVNERRVLADLVSLVRHAVLAEDELVPYPDVAEVERRLSVAREVESVVEKALVRASRLRQAVLRSAFEGRL